MPVAGSPTAWRRVLAGATQIQGTQNGYGERCGNANLTTLIPNLQLKLGYECVTAEQLHALTLTSHFFDELLNFTPDHDQPYVGRNAFAHKGGMHVAGVTADPSTFEHVEPEVVGNDRAVLVSELSGKGTIHARAAEAGLELDDAAASRLIERVKEREHEGYHYEAADGSFELLLRKESGDYTPLFTLESWRVIAEQRADGRVETEATIKLWVDGERYVFTAEGNGPVSALDKALRGALARVYPELDTIKLVNFKVRILDGAKASDAITRVLLDSIRRRTRVGRHRRLDERDRGVVGGARRLARARHAGWSPAGAHRRGAHAIVTATTRPPTACPAPLGRTSRSRWRGPCSASPRSGRCSRCCAPASSRWGRAGRSSSAPSPRAWAPASAAPSRRAQPACISRCAPSASVTVTR